MLPLIVLRESTTFYFWSQPIDNQHCSDAVPGVWLEPSRRKQIGNGKAATASWLRCKFAATLGDGGNQFRTIEMGQGQFHDFDRIGEHIAV